MRNPNGYGSVYKLSGKRRKPFAVRITTGWDDNGNQIFKYIGYYEKRQDALTALATYNENPNKIDVNMTFSEVFDKWRNDKYDKISRSAINGYNAAYEVSKSLHDMKFMDIKKMHMQEVINTCEKGYGTLRKIKTLYNQLFKYAMENDIVSKDYSSFVDIILIMIYTGFRIGELLKIKNDDIDLENNTIKGGIKTDAGKNRIVPINSKIRPFIERRKAQGYKYLIVNSKGTEMNYDNYYKDHWMHIMDQLGMNHKPHDCRHTFATMMNNADANKTSIKKIMGHNSYVTTEKIYTHKDLEELKKAIDLI